MLLLRSFEVRKLLFEELEQQIVKLEHTAPALPAQAVEVDTLIVGIAHPDSSDRVYADSRRLRSSSQIAFFNIRLLM